MGVSYRVYLQLVPGDPISFQLSDYGKNLNSDAHENSKCSTFDLFTNTLHVPCLDMGNSYWLDLQLMPGDPISFQLIDFGENKINGEVQEYKVMTQRYYPDDYYLAVVSVQGKWTSADVIGGPNIANTWENHAYLSERPEAGYVYTIRLCYDDFCIDYEDVQYTVNGVNDNFAWIITPAVGGVVASDSFTISWQAASGTVSHYFVIVSDDANNMIWTTRVGANSTSTTYNYDNTATSELQSGKTYTICLHSYDENGNQATTVSNFEVLVD